MATVERCKAINKAGRPCSAPVSENGFCSIHAHPELAKELGARGGRKNRHVVGDAPEVPLEPPTNPRQVKDALARIVADSYNGRIETRRATAAIYGGMALLKAFEISDFDARLNRLEELANAAANQANKVGKG